jgi:hypothetical protein
MTTDNSASFGDRLRAARDETAGIRGDVSDIAGELRQLLQLETDLARAELDEARRHAVRGAAFGGGAVVIGFIAAIFAFLTTMYVLATFLPTWLAALLTTALAAGIAYYLFSTANREVKQFSPVPRRFVRSIREDVEWLKAQTKSSAR